MPLETEHVVPPEIAAPEAFNVPPETVMVPVMDNAVKMEQIPPENTWFWLVVVQVPIFRNDPPEIVFVPPPPVFVRSYPSKSMVPD